MRSALLVVLLACSTGIGDAPSAASSSARGTGSAKATLLIHYPTGWSHRISVRGDSTGLSWKTGVAATWTDGDVWHLTVSAPAELKPLFDDSVWAMGPNYRVVAGQTLDIWPAFFHDAGSYQSIDGVRSKHVASAHDVTVYLPPSYDENPAERYPVVYMHDGQNLFFDEDSFGGVSWDVGGALDRGLADGSIHEAIVVGVWNDADRIWEYTPTDGGYGGGGADAYLAFVADELKPMVDARYRTLSDAAHTAMIGSSLGGLLSLDAGMTRSDVFALVGALSPSTWWDDTWVIDAEKTAALPSRIYLDSGDGGDSMDGVTDTAHLADTLRARGADLDYLVQHGGQHNEIYWRQRVPGALASLLGSR